MVGEAKGSSSPRNRKPCAAIPRCVIESEAFHSLPDWAVRVLLAAPPGSLTGSLALRQVTTWLVAEHGAAAVTDLAEELAADLAKALDAFAAAEGRPALAVLDCWFHDVPPPWDGSSSDGSRRG